MIATHPGERAQHRVEPVLQHPPGHGRRRDHGVAPVAPDAVHDVAHRTETACPQAHTFEVMRLALLAQRDATSSGFAR